MAIFDTHRAVKVLTAAGFEEAKAEAVVDAVGESHEDLATKGDLRELATKDDLRELATKDDLREFATKDDLRVLEQKTQAEIQDLAQKTQTEMRAMELRLQHVEVRLEALARSWKADLKDFELRLTLRLGALVVGANTVLAVLIVLLR